MSLLRFFLYLTTFMLIINTAYCATITKVRVTGNKKISEAKVLENAIKPGTEFDLKK